jgi:hypothetical protein
MLLPANPEADLRNAIQGSRAVIVAGTGVSMAASRDPSTGQPHPQASWAGLLKSGLEWLQKHDRNSASKAKAHLILLTTGAATYHFISAAQDVTNAMGGVLSPHFKGWLNRTIGTIKAYDRKVLDALEALRRHGNLLATTNYDGLLLNNGGKLKPVTWEKPAAFLRVARNRETDKVVFLHGYWRKPQSVILDWSSYQEIARDERYRQDLATIWQMTTWVYIGCGVAGLTDPDFGLLLERYGQRARQAGLWDFCLVRKDQCKDFQAYFDELEVNICAISFGESYDDLAQYLRSLLVSNRSPGLAIAVAPIPVRPWSELPRELDSFYAHVPDDSLTPQVRCLLTDTGQSDVVAFNIFQSAKYRPLGTRPGYSDDANYVPLHPDLVAALEEETAGMAPSNHIENPEKLVTFANVRRTAARHAKQWRLGRAIGCYRLALCLCPPSYDKDERLQIACEPIRHLRHHEHPDVLNNALFDVEEQVRGMRVANKETLLSLEYNLLALLDEHGLQEKAMAFAKEQMKLIDRYGKNLKLDQVGSMKRRVYSICLTNPDRYDMRRLHGELEEQAMDIGPLRASLATTQVVEALLAFINSDYRSAKKSLEEAWELVDSRCKEFQRVLDAGKKPNAGPTDVAELFIYRGMLARLVKPDGWTGLEAYSFDSAKARFSEVHAHLTNPTLGFWNTVLLRAGVDPSSKAQIAVLTRRLSRKELPDPIKETVWRILKQARSMLVKP